MRLLIETGGMLAHCFSMAVGSCWILAELEDAVIYPDPEHSKHTQRVTCLVSLPALQELGYSQLSGITYRALEHGAVRYHATPRGDGCGTTVGLGLWSRYLSVFDMPSIKCTCVCCPSIHKLLAQETTCPLSAICPVQWKQGFIHEEKTSPKCQTPSNLSIFPWRLWPPTADRSRRACKWASLWWFMQKFLGYAKGLLQGWCGYTWSTVVRPHECTAKFSEKPLETAYMEEKRANLFMSKSSGRHSCSMPTALSFITRSVAVLCDKAALFRVAGYCWQPEAYLCNNHAAWAASWWTISGKEKCSVAQIWSDLWTI